MILHTTNSLRYSVDSARAHLEVSSSLTANIADQLTAELPHPLSAKTIEMLQALYSLSTAHNALATRLHEATK